MRKLIVFFGFLSSAVFGQVSDQSHAGEIKLKLKKLNVLGAVLYVAAHPDDENTRAIAYLANERMVTTAYLSMTRGDGGQNLIGPEIRDLLGLIRTQELLTARKIDGGQQFFTRANDFGFSKNSAETFEIWNRDIILSDVVQVIRKFQPDVILTRFPPDERAGHGHHTASAVLAQEAFDLSGNPKIYPEQVKELGVWQPKRLLTNTGRWWTQNIDQSTPGVTMLDVGTYNQLLGKSYSEIAATSRTQHKSQGFGSQGRRGEAPEYFEFAKGEQADPDILESVNTTWTRVKGGEKVKALVEKAIETYNLEMPSASVPLLVEIRKEISALENGIWKTRKLEEVEGLIRDCLGLYLEMKADNFWVAPGHTVNVSFELVNRSNLTVMLERIRIPKLEVDSAANLDLGNNKLISFKSKKNISSAATYSDPYWLREEHPEGYFTVKDQRMIGSPENSPSVMAEFVCVIQGQPITFQVPLVYKWTDPVKGELSRPFEITPPVVVNISESVMIFSDANPKQINLRVKSISSERINGSLKLDLPKGWTAMPVSVPFEILKRGEEQNISFMVTPAKQEISSSIKAIASIGDKEYDYSLQTIEYDHIPIQTLLPKSKARAVRIDLKKEGGVIGYIRGAGDEIPLALRNMGYEVWEMKNEEVTPSNLKKVDAVVLGIRALNTNERIRHIMPDLLEYVKSGGTMIVQYNTTSDFEIDRDKFAPYPITLSRERVTEENSEVRILMPDHPLLNYPNKINQQDFNGWVQERGLYFPGKWDERYDALLSMNDKGEPPRDGSVLVAQFGEGHYIYTGLSFFRELPEGVAGAYKLFTNMVSLRKIKSPQNTKVKTANE